MPHNHDWLSLIDVSGLLVSEPVLHERFPDGPPPQTPWIQRRFRTEYERWRATHDRCSCCWRRSMPWRCFMRVGGVSSLPGCSSWLSSDW